jgi:hypothetical protein
VAGADAVAARVASADDDDLAPTGIHGHRLRLAGDDAILAGQKIHGLVDAIELTARYGQVPRPGGTAAEHQCIEIGA